MLPRTLSFLLCLLFCACSLSAPPGETRPALTGKVSRHNQGISGVTVSAWPATGTTGLNGKAPYRSAPSTADGTFALSLPAGDYYLLARGGKLFSFYGRNPLTIPPEGLEGIKIGLVPLPNPPEITSVAIEEGVSGELSGSNGPLAGALVYAYTDLNSNLKGMGYAVSPPSDEKGHYQLSLPAGTYYLLARLRQGGGMAMGPLRSGDYSGYAPENPVRVTSNRVSLVSIPLLEVPEKVNQLGASLFGQTSLRGRVIDKAGKPVPGVRAILYSEKEMLNRPDYVSQPTDAAGEFVLSFPRGGTYYLSARQELGGAPAPGELYGTYDGSRDHSLTIATGEQKENVVVIVEAMW